MNHEHPAKTDEFQDLLPLIESPDGLLDSVREINNKLSADYEPTELDLRNLRNSLGRQYFAGFPVRISGMCYDADALLDLDGEDDDDDDEYFDPVISSDEVPEMIDASEAYLSSFELCYFDDVPKIVLVYISHQQTSSDNDPDDNTYQRTYCMLPESILRLEAANSGSISDTLNSYICMTREVFSSSDFRREKNQQAQREYLENHMENISEVINDEYGGFNVELDCSEFFRVYDDDKGLKWEDSVDEIDWGQTKRDEIDWENAYVNQYDNIFDRSPVNGVIMGAVLPEMIFLDPKKRINGTKDFKMSGGLPFLAVYDEVLECTSFVPFDAVDKITLQDDTEDWR